jgi:rhamnulokinase
MGTEIAKPIITDASRELNFTNETGYGGAIHFSKQTAGFWILEEVPPLLEGKGPRNR